MMLNVVLAPKDIPKIYQNIKTILFERQDILFINIKEVDESFEMPNDASEYSEKHTEVENNFDFTTYSQDDILLFFEKVYTQVKEDVPLRSEEVLQLIDISTVYEDLSYRLLDDLSWALVWKVKTPYESEKEEIILRGFIRGHEPVVKEYIIEYLNSSILAFRQNLYASAIALFSIAIEATFRDVLQQRGFAYHSRSSGVEIYDYTEASLSVENGKYTISFINDMPKSTEEFLNSVNGEDFIPIKIRRTKKTLSGGRERLDLHIRAPESIIDHLSTSVLTEEAARTISGLNGAIYQARREGIINNLDFPPSFAKLLIEVRNNLIHLSGGSFENPEVNELLKDGSRVFSVMVRLTHQFIYEQYAQLNRQP